MIASSEWIIIRNSRLNPQYLVYVLQSKYFLDKMMSNTSGVGGSLTRAKPYEVKKYELPIPPLNEQSRIVSKIEELFSTLDQMEQNLI
jgi:type I restriction enzyme S subunit